MSNIGKSLIEEIDRRSLPYFVGVDRKRLSIVKTQTELQQFFDDTGFCDVHVSSDVKDVVDRMEESVREKPRIFDLLYMFLWGLGELLSFGLLGLIWAARKKRYDEDDVNDPRTSDDTISP